MRTPSDVKRRRHKNQHLKNYLDSVRLQKRHHTLALNPTIQVHNTFPIIISLPILIPHSIPHLRSTSLPTRQVSHISCPQSQAPAEPFTLSGLTTFHHSHSTRCCHAHFAQVTDHSSLLRVQARILLIDLNTLLNALSKHA